MSSLSAGCSLSGAGVNGGGNLCALSKLALFCPRKLSVADETIDDDGDLSSVALASERSRSPSVSRSSFVFATSAELAFSLTLATSKLRRALR